MIQYAEDCMVHSSSISSDDTLNQLQIFFTSTSEYLGFSINAFKDIYQEFLLQNTTSCLFHKRNQRKIVNRNVSGWIEVKKVVPQRTVLGLFLFNLYINDIENCLWDG